MWSPRPWTTRVGALISRIMATNEDGVRNILAMDLPVLGTASSAHGSSILTVASATNSSTS